MSDDIALALDALVPVFENERGDWERVIRDARRSDPRRRLPARPIVVLAALLAAILIPLVAVAASQEWWFFRFDGAPSPATPVAVVQEGVWDGKPWQLLAYRSTTDGICFGITPTNSHPGEGAGMNCDQIDGVPRTADSKPYARHGITFLEVSASELPTYVAGPVVYRAAEVAIHFDDGTVVRTPTFAAPESLGSAIRFYVVRLPSNDPQPLIDKLVAFDADGHIVACLTTAMLEGGVPLSACA